MSSDPHGPIFVISYTQRMQLPRWLFATDVPNGCLIGYRRSCTENVFIFDRFPHGYESYSSHGFR